MKVAAAIICVLTLLSGVARAAPAAAPLLELKAQSVSWGLVMPIPPVANLVVGTVDKSKLDQCVRDQRLQPRAYRGLLLSWAYPSSPGHQLHVVRASEKYCGLFYGARDFNYYLIDEHRSGGRSSFRLLLANRGDRLAVLPAVTNGFNEIETAGCNAGGCRIARMAFDGRRYRPVQCDESVIRGKTEVRQPRRCGSDTFPDDQPPAPTSRPRR